MDNFLLDNLAAASWNYPFCIHPLRLPEITAADIHADVLRLDKLHPVVSGNKWFKLKGHLQKALRRSPSSILTFGGAWSNHIIATAYAAQQTGVPSIGIIRGERPPVLSATLQSAAVYGMHLEFISRAAYAEKGGPAFQQDLTTRFPGVYIIPEGGAGTAGIKGSEYILREIPAAHYTHILCAVGTGTMLLGLAGAASPGQEVLGIPVLKGMNDVSAINRDYPSATPRLIPHYHFGGYARLSQELLDSMNRLYRDAGIPTDFVYTGKLFYGVLDMIRRHFFPPHSRLLIVHSGGLQGNRSLPRGTLDFQDLSNI
jgi:1-aminocyclopropane-1-carboxylate deaminase